MVSLIKRFFQIRIIRYGLVGGIGIPIQNAFLLLFLLLLSQKFFLLANALAFIFSNIINFILNQLFTYREQVKGIHGWEWVRRFFKGQLTSSSSLLLSYLIATALVYLAHANDYLSTDTGIVIAFLYNFFVSNKLVFRATADSATPARSAKPEALTGNPGPEMESTPK